MKVKIISKENEAIQATVSNMKEVKDLISKCKLKLDFNLYDEELDIDNPDYNKFDVIIPGDWVVVNENNYFIYASETEFNATWKKL